MEGGANVMEERIDDVVLDRDPQSMLRLTKARAALRIVEEECGVKSYAHRSFGSVSNTSSDPLVQRGVFSIGTRIESIVTTVGTFFDQPVWVAVLGISDLGWEAAANAGWDLKRVVVIHCDASQNATVLATLLEGFDVLVVGHLVLRPSEQKVIAARARSLDRLVLTSYGWATSNGSFFGNLKRNEA